MYTLETVVSSFLAGNPTMEEDTENMKYWDKMISMKQVLTVYALRCLIMISITQHVQPACTSTIIYSTLYICFSHLKMAEHHSIVLHLYLVTHFLYYTGGKLLC